MLSKLQYKINRVISTGTLVFFITSNSAWGLPAAGISITPFKEIPGFLQIEIPSELASIEEVYEAPPQPDPRLILHIQNLHGNENAQGQIKKLLGYLYEKYGFKMLFVEGAVEELNPEYLRLFPDKERNVKLAEALVKQGELTGVEYYLMDGPKDVRAIGIEKADLYRANYEAFRKVYGAKGSVDLFLSNLDGKLQMLSSRIFPQETRRILSEWKKFEAGHRDFLPFVKRVAQDSKRVLGLDLESLFAQVEWPQITRLLVLQAMEKDMNRQSAMAERVRLVEYLKSKQVPVEISAAVEKLGDRKITVSRKDDPREKLENLPRYLFERLVEEAGPKGFRFSDYPAFSLWAGHLILETELDSKQLFDEIHRVFEKILVELAVSEAQKNLLELYQDGELLRKLYALEVNRKEWERVRYRREWIDPKIMTERLLKMEQALPRANSLLQPPARIPAGASIADLTDIFTTALEFYDFARKREDVFYETIEREMGKGKTEKAVLVTGGFHTDGIMEKLREREINYSVLMPKITGSLDNSNYVSAMLENRQTMFDLATLEAPIKQQDGSMVIAQGVNTNAEARGVVSAVIGILQSAEGGLEQVHDALKHFENTLYVSNRDLNVKVNPREPNEQVMTLGLPGGSTAEPQIFEIHFSLTRTNTIAVTANKSDPLPPAPPTAGISVPVLTAIPKSELRKQKIEDIVREMKDLLVLDADVRDLRGNELTARLYEFYRYLRADIQASPEERILGDIFGVNAEGFLPSFLRGTTDFAVPGEWKNAVGNLIKLSASKQADLWRALKQLDSKSFFAALETSEGRSVLAAEIEAAVLGKENAREKIKSDFEESSEFISLIQEIRDARKELIRVFDQVVGHSKFGEDEKYMYLLLEVAEKIAGYVRAGRLPQDADSYKNWEKGNFVQVMLAFDKASRSNVGEGFLQAANYFKALDFDRMLRSENRALSWEKIQAVNAEAYKTLVEKEIWAYRFSNFGVEPLIPFIQHLPETGIILDAGTGVGRVAAALQRNLPKRQVVGIDVVQEMIDQAKTIQARSGASFELLDIMDINPKISVAGVWAGEMIQNFPPDRAVEALRKIRALLPAGAPAFLSVSARSFFENWKYQWIEQETPFSGIVRDYWGRGGWLPVDRYFKFYSPEEFQILVEEAGFKVESIEETKEGWLNLYAVAANRSEKRGRKKKDFLNLYRQGPYGSKANKQESYRFAILIDPTTTNYERTLREIWEKIGKDKKNDKAEIWLVASTDNLRAPDDFSRISSAKEWARYAIKGDDLEIIIPRSETRKIGDDANDRLNLDFSTAILNLNPSQDDTTNIAGTFQELILANPGILEGAQPAQVPAFWQTGPQTPMEKRLQKNLIQRADTNKILRLAVTHTDNVDFLIRVLKGLMAIDRDTGSIVNRDIVQRLRRVTTEDEDSPLILEGTTLSLRSELRGMGGKFRTAATALLMAAAAVSPAGESSKAPMVSGEQAAKNLEAERNRTAEALEQAQAGVVAIRVSREGGNDLISSGIIVDKSGLILTFSPAIPGADITVVLSDGTILKGKKVAGDPYFSLVKIQTENPLHVLDFADRELWPGEDTYKLGAPHGYRNTVTGGTISANNRDLGIYKDLVQTDATVNPGDPGGPVGVVVNGKFLVDAITMGQYDDPDAQGINFAFPSRQALAFLEKNAALLPGGAPQAAKTPAVSNSKIEAVKEARKGVVTLRTERKGEKDLVGSGAVVRINEEAQTVWILTSYDAVPSGKLNVVLSDGTTFEGRKIASDTQLQDLALIEIRGVDKANRSKLKELPFAKIGSYPVGSPLFGVTAPYGLPQTITGGIVTADKRKHNAPNGDQVWKDLLQTNVGGVTGLNWGGVLLNPNAEIAGLIAAKRHSAQRISFAITSKRLQEFLKSIEVLPLEGRQTAIAAPRLDPIAQLVPKVQPSVVTIRIPREGQKDKIGSGSIIRVDGKTVWVLTNYHVAESANPKVVLSDGTSFQGQRIAFDADLDLALVQFEADRELKPLPFAKEAKLAERVAAFGAPYGHENTVSEGIASAMKREIHMPNGYLHRSLLQTDAAINPGNSGGPLVNFSGEIVGVNVATRDGSQGTSFAIPASVAQDFLEKAFASSAVQRKKSRSETRAYEDTIKTFFPNEKMDPTLRAEMENIGARAADRGKTELSTRLAGFLTGIDKKMNLTALLEVLVPYLLEDAVRNDLDSLIPQAPKKVTAMKKFLDSIQFRSETRSIEKVLLVEDEPTVAFLLEVQLKARGYEVVVTTNGDEAWDKFQESLKPGEKIFDTVISDTDMQGATQVADGLVLADLISKASPMPQTYMMMMSGKVRTEHTTLLGTTFVHFLEKPFLPADFKKMLDEVEKFPRSETRTKGWSDDELRVMSSLGRLIQQLSLEETSVQDQKKRGKAMKEAVWLLTSPDVTREILESDFWMASIMFSAVMELAVKGKPELMERALSIIKEDAQIASVLTNYFEGPGSVFEKLRQEAANAQKPAASPLPVPSPHFEPPRSLPEAPTQPAIPRSEERSLNVSALQDSEALYRSEIRSVNIRELYQRALIFEDGNKVDSRDIVYALAVLTIGMAVFKNLAQNRSELTSGEFNYLQSSQAFDLMVFASRFLKIPELPLGPHVSAETVLQTLRFPEKVQAIMLQEYEDLNGGEILLAKILTAVKLAARALIQEERPVEEVVKLLQESPLDKRVVAALVELSKPGQIAWLLSPVSGSFNAKPEKTVGKEDDRFARFRGGLPEKAWAASFIGVDSPDLLPQNLWGIGLTHGLVPASASLDEAAIQKVVELIRQYAVAVSQNPKDKIFEQAARQHPLAAASNAPGAVALITGTAPRRLALNALEAQLIANPKQYFRIVVPHGAIPAPDMLNLRMWEQAMAEKVGDRFAILEIKKRAGRFQMEDLSLLPGQILQLMQKEGHMPGNVKVDNFRKDNFVQWIDQSAAESLKDLVTVEDPYATIMESNLPEDLQALGAQAQGQTEEIEAAAFTLGATIAMKASQRILNADEIKQDLADALSWNGTRIGYRFTPNLVTYVLGLMQTLKLISSAA